MKPSKPPAMATWLVEHLNPGDRNEALAGDLLEQFSQGRSVAWYWRQALVETIVALTKQWRFLAWAVIMALLRAGFFHDWHFGRTLWITPWAQAYFGWGMSQPEFFFLISATAYFAGHILYPLYIGWASYASMNLMVAGDTAFDAVTWKGRWRRLWLLQLRPLSGGILAMTFSTLLLLALLPARPHPVFVGNIVGLLPMFFGLVVARWSVPMNVVPYKFLINLKKFLRGLLQFFRDISPFSS